MVLLRNRKQTGEPVKEKHIVTGGGGYPGYRLGKALVAEGIQVVLFDIIEPCGELLESMEFVKGDIRKQSDVENVVKGADCIYHLASYGMSGRDQLNKKQIEEVNIKGTQNIIEACIKYGVQRLVYTSTFNVVFGGQEIRDGDETIPYLPLEKHPDHYSRTKSIAEMKVMEANGTKIADGRVLSTCALRLAGVYGPGEMRHLPRIVSYIERGLFAVTYGARDSLVEFLHVENLVLAHLLAGKALSKEKEHIAAGQTYFISDGKPVNNFEFFRPLVEGLGYSYPKVNVPLTLVYFFAFITEMVHLMVSKVYNFQPLLTRTEVYKTGVTHYFNIGKSRRDLGYEPIKQNDLQDVVKHFIKLGHGKRIQIQSKFARYFVDVIIGIIFALLLMSCLPVTK
ncbi:short-chain dehydrogenase/reductase family 42E member 1 [Lingula anatina]|uniref:Short-chain dehydrogenase/reductase family 42E member 1 n=1 Tax=Lingula anatina TaxID=7574 RepID=A0A1S3JPD2_LINAN|nr:short-chain dehydrogenase/reductase family 42E member 1 [Lingula anatina]|eukprot:XP_013412218.1 short-chain dehydrogenase/reductase family 42E member 1 [Lingula anatina]